MGQFTLFINRFAHWINDLNIVSSVIYSIWRCCWNVATYILVKKRNVTPLSIFITFSMQAIFYDKLLFSSLYVVMNIAMFTTFISETFQIIFFCFQSIIECTDAKGRYIPTYIGWRYIGRHIRSMYNLFNNFKYSL